MTTTPLPGTFISQLPTATSLTGAELVPVVQGGTTKTATAAQLLSGSGSFLGLNDTPKSYVSQALKGLRVNSGQTGVQFAYGFDSSVLNVKDFGAVGDGVTDDTTALQNALNAAYVPTGGDPTGSPNKILFIPAGVYKTTSTLTISGAGGLIMAGAGNFTSTIKNTAGSIAIYVNGAAYCRFSDFQVLATGATAFSLSWTGGGSGLINTHENVFENMSFAGSIGLEIGHDGFQASENLITNCFFSGCTTAGIKVSNFNALQQTVIGGNFESCGIGIWVASGSVPVIHGVGFQNGSNTADIQVDNFAGDTYSVAGCRTESVNFIKPARGKFHVSGCTQLNATGGIFFNDGGHEISHIDDCNSQNGQIGMYGGGHVSNSDIGRDDWFNTGGGTAKFTFENLYVGKTSGGIGTGTQKFLGKGFVAAGVAYSGFSYAGISSLSPLILFDSATEIFLTNNTFAGLTADFNFGSHIGWDAYCSQADQYGYFGGGNNYSAAYAGEVLSQFYGYGNSSAGINHNVNYSFLQAEIDSPTPGAEYGKWVFLGRQNGVDNVQWMQVGQGLAVGSSSVTLPGQGNIAASGTVLTGTSSVGGLPAAGTVGRRYFVTDASTNTFATVVASGGTNKVPVWDDGTNWRIG